MYMLTSQFVTQLSLDTSRQYWLYFKIIVLSEYIWILKYRIPYKYHPLSFIIDNLSQF